MSNAEITSVYVAARPGPHAMDVKAGPIYDESGQMFLVALRDVFLGEMRAASAFVKPDFSRPKIGETNTKAAQFWAGKLQFHQVSQ